MTDRLSKNVYRRFLVAAVTTLLLSTYSRFGNAQEHFQVNSDVTNQENQSTKTEIPKLEVNTPVEREIKGGENHKYDIDLTAGQYLKLAVNQRGVDVVLSLSAPDGKGMIFADSPGGSYSLEQIEAIGETAGSYRLNIWARKQNESGSYNVKVLRVQTATPKERALAEAFTLNLRANGLRFSGKYESAIPLAERALSIREAVSGPESIDVAESLKVVGDLYMTKGDFVRSEVLLKRSLDIYEKDSGVEDLEVGRLLASLAHLYVEKRDYVKAESLLLRAMRASQNAPEDSRSDLNYSLARLYLITGDLSKAEPLLLRSLEYSEKIGNVEDQSVRRAGLGGLYRLNGDYKKAEQFLIHAIADSEKAHGLDHPYSSYYLGHLATVYEDKGDYTKAESLYLRALTIAEQAFGENHPDTTAWLNILARLYQTTGRFSQAIAIQTRSNDASDRDLRHNLSTGSERQRLLYLNRTTLDLDFTLSLHAQWATSDLGALRMATSALLQRKGRGLDTTMDAHAALRRRALPEDQGLLDQFAEARKQLSQATLRGPGKEGIEKHRAILADLEEKAEKLEIDLSQRSADFRAQLQTQSAPVTIDGIQKLVPNKAALVEFAVYRPFDARGERKRNRFGNPRYAAYVVRNAGEPAFVELGDAKTIDDKIGAFRNALRNKSRRDVTRLARAVDASVMQPVRKLLGETSTILLSPDGPLNLIPFAALVDERGKYLVTRYSFTYLTSGRDLLRLQTKVQDKTAKMVIADPDFGEVNSMPSSDPDGGVLDDLYFPPLKATQAEAQDLQRLFPDATVLTKAQATETALKAAERPAILHIATHGFFLSDDQLLDSQSEGENTRIVVRRKDKPRVIGDDDASQLVNPLLRSGLGLAGANQRTGSDGNDGILTALEAAGLDLWGTKLVVLSACDTGVGKVVNGDGVYGLRRALVLAGSESQMMSLWPVSDRGTRELMIEYYKRLKAGEGRSKALRHVQLKMLASKNRHHPFYWASFIQSGEWANLDGQRVD